MDNSEFMSLHHAVGECRIASRGTEVAPGYKPDLTVVDPGGQLAFIVECEQTTNRKVFVGDLTKAANHADGCGARPVLVIVLKEQPNTTVSQIAKHLAPFARRESSLVDVFVISDQAYRRSVECHEVLKSPEFRDRSFVVG